MDRYLAPLPLLIMILALLVGISITVLLESNGAITTGFKLARKPHSPGLSGVIVATVLFGGCLLIAGALFGSFILATPFAGFAAALPQLLSRAKAQSRQSAIANAWPDAIDHLVSGIRSGLSLGESLTTIGIRGPVPLRPYFIALGNDLAAGAALEAALVRFADECADPIADQLMETILIAHEVGGAEIGRLLRTLSQFLRLETQTRDEIRVRQGWVINGARVAAAAPWVLLALLSLRRESAETYETGGGVLLLVLGAFITAIAYQWMRRLARLGVGEP